MQQDHRISRRRGLIIGAIAAGHYLLTLFMLLMMLGTTMARFDGGNPSRLSESFFEGAFAVLASPMFALLQLFDIKRTGLWGGLGFIANSVLWGWAGWRVIRFRRTRRLQRSVTIAEPRS
jgi:hypothetical protein